MQDVLTQFSLPFYFAGDYTSKTSHTWIQDAVESASRVAQKMCLNNATAVWYIHTCFNTFCCKLQKMQTFQKSLILNYKMVLHCTQPYYTVFYYNSMQVILVNARLHKVWLRRYRAGSDQELPTVTSQGNKRFIWLRFFLSYECFLPV